MKELDTDDPLPDKDEFRKLGYKPLSDAAAHAIYLILVNVCGAPLAYQDQFMYWATENGPGDEYRFCGIFGMAGKIWIKRDKWYVSGPNNDEMRHFDKQYMDDAESRANGFLNQVRDKYVAGHLR